MNKIVASKPTGQNLESSHAWWEEEKEYLLQNQGIVRLKQVR